MPQLLRLLNVPENFMVLSRDDPAGMDNKLPPGSNSDPEEGTFCDDESLWSAELVELLPRDTICCPIEADEPPGADDPDVKNPSAGEVGSLELPCEKPMLFIEEPELRLELSLPMWIEVGLLDGPKFDVIDDSGMLSRIGPLGSILKPKKRVCSKMRNINENTESPPSAFPMPFSMSFQIPFFALNGSLRLSVFLVSSSRSKV